MAVARVAAIALGAATAPASRLLALAPAPKLALTEATWLKTCGKTGPGHLPESVAG